MRMVVLALVLALLPLSACGVARDDGGGDRPAGGGSTGRVDPDEPVTMTPEPGSRVHDVDEGPQRVQPRPGMADLRKIRWEKARQGSGGRSLLVTYWSGVEPCNVLDHIEVDYKPSRIVVTLYEGHDPAEGDVACIELALLKEVVVELDQPVRGRQIVDGAG